MPGDNRIFTSAQVILATVSNCLDPRCFPTVAVLPGPPEQPCDMLAIYMDTDEPIALDTDFDDPNTCVSGQFVVNYVLTLQRCCAIPPPVLNPLGTGVIEWQNVTEASAIAQQLQTDLMDVWQCLLCNRESLFGYCAPMRVRATRSTVDSCYQHNIVISVVFDSDCCIVCPPLPPTPPPLPLGQTVPRDGSEPAPTVPLFAEGPAPLPADAPRPTGPRDRLPRAAGGDPTRMPRQVAQEEDALEAEERRLAQLGFDGDDGDGA